ncbi:DUF4755 domain-containing protein [Bradyrhizobium sp.]|uniref:DUF4755 domain-containing protein n=1 Tax=Bradyrhizobium sp. TaxID=376 RepID=UPI0039E49C22
MAIMIAAALTMSASYLVLRARRAKRQAPLLIAAIMTACAGVVILALCVEPSVALLIGLITFALPWLFIWVSDKHLRRIAFDSYVRQTISADHTGWFDGSGIALDSKNRKLILAGTAGRKVYGFDDIREWKSSFLFGGTTQLYGSADGDPLSDLEWAALDLTVRVHSSTTSSLFIRVRDPEHPEWQIRGITDKQTIRWFDLLQLHVASERERA